MFGVCLINAFLKRLNKHFSIHETLKTTRWNTDNIYIGELQQQLQLLDNKMSHGNKPDLQKKNITTDHLVSTHSPLQSSRLHQSGTWPWTCCRWTLTSSSPCHCLCICDTENITFLYDMVHETRHLHHLYVTSITYHLHYYQQQPNIRCPLHSYRTSIWIQLYRS